MLIKLELLNVMDEILYDILVSIYRIDKRKLQDYLNIIKIKLDLHSQSTAVKKKLLII